MLKSYVLAIHLFKLDQHSISLSAIALMYFEIEQFDKQISF